MSRYVDVAREWWDALMEVERAGKAIPRSAQTAAHRRSKKWRRMRRKWNRQYNEIVRQLRREGATR